MKEFTAGASLGQQYLFLEKPDATARHRHISIKSPTHVDVDYKRHRYQIGEKCFLLFTVCLFRPLCDWWQAFCRQMLCVCLQIKLHENSREQVTVSCGGSLLAILFRVKSNHSAHFILSPHITQSCRCQSPQKTECTHKVWFNQLPHAYMTEVGLGRIQALGPKWVAGYGPWRKCALLWWRKKKERGWSSDYYHMSRTTELYQWHGRPAGKRAHLLGEISIGSLVEPEDSKCSRWPGNLHWSVSHDSCSWSPTIRCNFVPFWCLLGDLVRFSLCLENLTDSDRWPAGFATSSCGTAMEPGVGLASEFSILHRW